MALSVNTGADKSDSSPPLLIDRIPPPEKCDADHMLDAFVEYTADLGLTLYPAQEEGVLEIMAGRHLILKSSTQIIEHDDFMPERQAMLSDV